MITTAAQFLKHNAIALVALFLALGGTSYAATQLAVNSVATKHIKANAVTTPKIKSGAVTGAKLANQAVTNDKLADGAVTGAKLGDDTVTGAKVLESSLGTVPNAANAAVAQSLPAPTWQNLTLLNGWAPYGGWGTPRYAKDAQGFVRLDGSVGGATSTNDTFAQLPVGYRPTVNTWLRTGGTNGAWNPQLYDIWVKTNGEMTVYPGTGANKAFVSLNGVVFPTN